MTRFMQLRSLAPFWSRIFGLFALCLLSACASATKENGSAPTPNVELRENVRAVIQANLPQVKGCWSKALETNPDLSGKVFIEWTIGAEGKVANADVSSSSIPSGQLSDCLLGAIRGWTFLPPPDGQPAKVLYPFVFTD